MKVNPPSINKPQPYPPIEAPTRNAPGIRDARGKLLQRKHKHVLQTNLNNASQPHPTQRPENTPFAAPERIITTRPWLLANQSKSMRDLQNQTQVHLNTQIHIYPYNPPPPPPKHQRPKKCFIAQQYRMATTEERFHPPDTGEHGSVFVTNLLKAFDIIKHKLLIAK